MDPFLAGSQTATPDAGQPVATDAVSPTEEKVEGTVQVAEEIFSTFMPQFAALSHVSLPLALGGIHLGFAIAHLFHHAQSLPKQPAPIQK